MDGFKNIPVDELRERINEVEKGKPVYLICQSGLRSYIASRILEGNGYEHTTSPADFASMMQWLMTVR